MTSPRIAFVSSGHSSFVREDLAILSERYEVHEFVFGAGGAAVRSARGFVAEQVRLSAWLRAELPSADAAFGWFADYHTAPLVAGAARRGVPVALVIGGYDAMRIPSRRHGVFASPWRAPLARRAVRGATVLLPVTEALLRTENAFLDADAQRQGLDVFAPRHAPSRVVPTGYDPDAWPLGPPDRERSVLTVGLIDSPRRAWIKGLDLLVEAARRLPAVRFDAVGVTLPGEVVGELPPPPNVHLHPPVARNELAAWYGRASVYAQLSRVEGMPNVLCEAMLCGAVPVGTAAFGIPDAIGDAGWTVASPDAGAIAGALDRALAVPPTARARARQRIAETFPLARRRRSLHTLMDGLVAGAPVEVLLT